MWIRNGCAVHAFNEKICPAAAMYAKKTKAILFLCTYSHFMMRRFPATTLFWLTLQKVFPEPNAAFVRGEQ
jgi:hypothetical protein